MTLSETILVTIAIAIPVLLIGLIWTGYKIALDEEVRMWLEDL